MPISSKVAQRNDRIDPSVWKTAFVVFFGPLMSSLDSTVVNVSLATLGRELHAPLSTIQWVTTGYLLALALTLPMTGWAVDRFGTKRVYLVCFTAFTLTSLLCGSAPSASLLILFRLLQGMAGGLLAPMAQMTIARVAGIHMARVMSVGVMPVLIGPILGPVMAGAILQHATWRWIFFINLPIGVAATLAALFILREDAGSERRRPLDFRGFALLAPALVLFLHGLESIGSRAANSAIAPCEITVAAVLVALFLNHCLRSPATSLLDVRLFRKPVFAIAAVTQFSTNAISFGGQLLLPLYLITARHMSTGETGMVLASAGVGMMFTYPFIGGLTERLGAKIVGSAGAMVALIATLPFALLGQAELPVNLIVAALFVRGVGLSAINIPSMTSAYASVQPSILPIATTAMNIVQRLGGPVGTTLLAVFLHSRLSAGSATAFPESFRLLCCVHVVCLVSALRLPAYSNAVRDGAAVEPSETAHVG